MSLNYVWRAINARAQKDKEESHFVCVTISTSCVLITRRRKCAVNEIFEFHGPISVAYFLLSSDPRNRKTHALWDVCTRSTSYRRT